MKQQDDIDNDPNVKGQDNNIAIGLLIAGISILSITITIILKIIDNGK